jgi:hypothetical protein
VARWPHHRGSSRLIIGPSARIEQVEDKTVPQALLMRPAARCQRQRGGRAINLKADKVARQCLHLPDLRDA